MPRTIFADRGLSMRLDSKIEFATEQPTWVAASRLGRLRVALPGYTIWLQIRGSCRISAAEGSFLLQRGEWIAFPPDSMPQLQTDSLGLTVGLVLPSLSENQSTSPYQYPVPLVGRGLVPHHELRLALRIWRNAAVREVFQTLAGTRPFVLNLSHAQHELMRQFSRCPGRSFRRKSVVFEKLQRARLFLDGNAHRLVRSTELATITGFSTWYLSKTFHCVYEAAPQTIAFRYRLQRARHLLLTTSLAIGEVGSACGFFSPATFARAFLSGHGMTASAFRKIAPKAKAGHRHCTWDLQGALRG